ncbi:uncharacterized protein LOC144863028 [Branchiostoma floridae x Branchiostoma japonicum]
MGHKNRIQTTLLVVVYLLLLGREGAALTVQQAAELKTTLEDVKAKCDAARARVIQTSLALNTAAQAEIVQTPVPIPTGQPDVNLAQGKPAFQTSNFAPSTVAGLAVDGNTNGRWNARSCACTMSQPTPEWWVDLGQTYIVNRVVIYNRWDCCRERLNPFNIHIGDSEQVTSNPKCGGDHRIALTEPSMSVSCPAMTGRYVGVRLPRTVHLTICEVQVFSNGVDPSPWSASSYHDSHLTPDRADINTREGESGGAWAAATNNLHQWLMRDLGEVKAVTGIITKGRDYSPDWIQPHNQFVTSYAISYGIENGDEQFYTDENDQTVVSIIFYIHLRYLLPHFIFIKYIWKYGNY